jgi:ribosomal-protein-alanine N-acetyltransferase
MKVLFETERLELRILEESNACLILDYYKRNREFLKEWDPIRDDEFYTLEYQRESMRKTCDSIEKGSSLRLWIFKKDEKAAGRVIGTIGFNNIVKGGFLSCFLGYSIDKDEINKGYITEALKKGIDIVFNDNKLHRIEANIMPKNAASRRVVEKLGFINEGVSRKYLKINGKWEDHIHMVLLNENIE